MSHFDGIGFKLVQFALSDLLLCQYPETFLQRQFRLLLLQDKIGLTRVASSVTSLFSPDCESQLRLLESQFALLVSPRRQGSDQL